MWITCGPSFASPLPGGRFFLGGARQPAAVPSTPWRVIAPGGGPTRACLSAPPRPYRADVDLFAFRAALLAAVAETRTTSRVLRLCGLVCAGSGVPFGDRRADVLITLATPAATASTVDALCLPEAVEPPTGDDPLDALIPAAGRGVR